MNLISTETFDDRSHAPAWECSLRRSSVAAGSAGADPDAFPRRSVGTIIEERGNDQ